MLAYKLITQDRKTRAGRSNETTWPIGEWREATGNLLQGLCSDAYMHCYSDPYLALFLNPIHAGLTDPIVCEVEVDGECTHDGQIKSGYRGMRVVRDLDIPAPTMEQYVEFAIRCAMSLPGSAPEFVQWATDWLTGKDRSAAAAADAAADAAYVAATNAATHAATHAAATVAAVAATYAVAVAHAAYVATHAAAAVAAYVDKSGAGPDLAGIARFVMRVDVLD